MFWEGRGSATSLQFIGLSLLGEHSWESKKANDPAASPYEHANRDFPGRPVVRTLRFHCLGSIPGRGTKIPQAMWHGNKNANKSSGE